MVTKLQMKFFALFLSLFFGLFLTTNTFADTYSMFNYLSIEGRVQEGSIVSASSRGYELCAKEYSEDVVGVVQKKGAVSFRGPAAEHRYPVTQVGTVPILVSAVNGDIQIGDYISTSTLPGVGMKASKQGAIIGIANTSFSSKRADEIGSIEATLNIRSKNSKTDTNTNTNTNSNSNINISTKINIDTNKNTKESIPLLFIGVGIALIVLISLFMIVRKKADLPKLA